MVGLYLQPGGKLLGIQLGTSTFFTSTHPKPMGTKYSKRKKKKHASQASGHNIFKNKKIKHYN
jgi:hypothetical protein